MHGMMRIISNFKEFYNDINAATLTGAIDVVVVEQPDGSFNCSPFHVRFGKLGVLRSKEKVVDIEVNGEPLDIHMKLGESGEAFFVEELEDDEENDIPDHLATSPIPVSAIEDMIFNSKGRRRSFNLENIDLNQTSSYEKRRYTADSQMHNSRAHLERDFLKRQIGLGNIEGTSVEDVTYSLTASRRSDEEDFSHSQNDVSETIFKMDSLDDPPSKIEQPEKSMERTPSPVKEEVQTESKGSKKKRKKMRKKNAPRKSTSNNNVVPSPGAESADKASDSTTDRSSLGSNSSEAELKELHPKMEKISTKDSTDTIPKPEQSNVKKVDADFHFFSDTELTSGNAESRSVSPTNVESVQSDSEIEMKLRGVKEESNEPSKSWEWGHFPSVSQATSPNSEDPVKEEQKSTLSSMFWFMKFKHNSQSRSSDGGMYLSNITPEMAEMYFRYKKDQARDDTDMDCESGNGPSLTQSPNSPEGCKSIDSDFDEQTKLVQTYSQDVALSVCGWEPNLTMDKFNEHLVSFTDFCNDHSILDNPKLVARINDRFYSWKVAVPMLVSIMCFGRPLMQACVDQLCNTHMSSLEPNPTKPTQIQVTDSKNQPHKSSWWHWGSRSSRESTPAKDAAIVPTKRVDMKTSTTNLVVEEVVAGNVDVVDAATQDTEKPVENLKKPEKDLQIDVRSESPKLSDKCRKTLRLSSKQIEALNLRDGMNEVEFSVTTAYQGTTRCQCHLYKWKWDDKIVISDIDGTITKSDVLGHILPIVGKDWAQSGVAHLFNKIKDNGYKLLYLSARAIGQARITRDYLRSIKQGDMSMPDGPILLNPTSLITAFHREVIEKKPEAFKISCMSDIKALFPVDSEPFYAGYGNRINDVWAYRAVGIPIHRIFTINPKGELKHELTQTFQSSYTNMSVIVDQMFPSRIEPANDYSQFSYWREPLPDLEIFPAILDHSS